VEGNVMSRRLAMAEGAIVRGRVDTGANRAADPSKQQPAGQVVKHASSSR
jgi:cytoskeletal protein CcmA (bactofilin family)